MMMLFCWLLLHALGSEEGRHPLISSHIRVAARRPAVGVSSGRRGARLQQREGALPIVLYARHARGDFERIGSTRTVHSRPRTRRRKDLVLGLVWFEGV